MERLPRLEGRIASIRELRELMRAMRAMAASHVQEGQSALAGIREYTSVIESAIGEGLRLLAQAPAPAASTPGEDSKVVVVICSEHGFVGGFNEHLVDRAIAELDPGCRIAVVGRRGADQLAERSVEPVWSVPMATHAGGVLSVARQAAERLAGVSAVRLVFADYQSGVRYEVASRSVLPLDPLLFSDNGNGVPPLHHLSPAVLLERLAGEYLLAEIARAMMESFASENAARLQMMESADRNIDARVQHLVMQARHLRQEAITSELLDLITGAEAILSNGST
jgi:F-type H+-transporting ATPase subunit gamma